MVRQKVRYRKKIMIGEKSIMFNQYLSDKRLPVPTPDSVVDANGKVAFGTFDKEFKKYYLTVSSKGTLEFNKFVYLSQRRAYEISQIDYRDRFFVMSSVRNTGIDKKYFHIFFIVIIVSPFFKNKLAS